MARPRNFDEGRALDAAMRTFWEKGYEATSTQGLCDATGLGRSSVYNTFKSEHDLFERALAHYIDTMTTAQLALLKDTRLSGAERVRALFAWVVDGETEHRAGGRSLGCLTVNTTVEPAGRDDRATDCWNATRPAAWRPCARPWRRAGATAASPHPGTPPPSPASSTRRSAACASPAKVAPTGRRWRRSPR
ncbi:hypothetical protein SUDANB105_03179 [Streptomyces sp. enrichment culture]